MPHTHHVPASGMRRGKPVSNTQSGCKNTSPAHSLRCEGSQFLDGDGRFPNHIPNPENKAAMQAGSRMVTESGADLGIVFDTDVDRSAVVARDGEAINSNRYIALMSYIALRCVQRVARALRAWRGRFRSVACLIVYIVACLLTHIAVLQGFAQLWLGCRGLQ